MQGSQLQAGNDLGLTALTDVKLLSASDTSVLDGTNSSLGGSLGIGFNIGQGKLGLTLNASVNMGRSSQQGEGETHTLSTANAGHGLNIVSGQDTRLTGAQVSAARSQWEQDHKGKTATQADIHDQLFATAYN
ncbi:hemagglutinin repeat-containing protein, partial [Biostraticola tofi]|uniref:hemagglutinin repeat-containing protein n=1 Tax=Biostraticola tofi TaxID=466109 RepID=UPI001E51FD92